MSTLREILESADAAADVIDRRVGFAIDRIEAGLLAEARRLRPAGSMANFGEALHGGHQTWVGLDPQVLNTPYDELLRLVARLAPRAGDLLVDLGAGYGRLGLVLHALFPDARFRGYELVRDRVAEGNRVLALWGTGDAKLVVQDLTRADFVLEPAEFYFLYDYGKVEHIRRTLSQLAALADRRRFTVVARGKGSRSLIEHEHPWLTRDPGPAEENFSIYTF
jgi:hypothetical protein